jgi:hypothetical protein
MTFGRILRRSFLYLGLAVGSLIIFTLIFALSVRTHTSIPGPWIMLAVFTAVLAFALIKPSRGYWKCTSFWLICAAELAVHVTVFIYLLRLYPQFKPVWFVPIIVVEAGIFGAICSVTLGRSTSSINHGRRAR